MNITHVRTRWAAIGAAVAITLGAGGIGITHATTSSGEKPIYKPINPCRMAAFGVTPFNVGPRTTPIGTNEIIDLDGWGALGDCNLPTGTTGLALNVTAINATTLTYLTFFPQGATQPTTANLNPSPGQPPTPNAVNVGLSAAGKFSLYNLAGTVGVFIDVVGVYDDHNHDDRYYTKAESDAQTHDGGDIVDESLTGADIDDNTLTSADIQNEPGLSWTNKLTTTTAFGTADIVASSVLIRPPSTGYVTVNASLDWFSATTDAQIRCQITDGAQTISSSVAVGRDTSPSTSDTAQSLALTQTFAVPKYTGIIFSGQSFRLVCDSLGGDSRIGDIHMTATFIPSNYAPFNIIVPIGLPDRLGAGAATE